MQGSSSGEMSSAEGEVGKARRPEDPFPNAENLWRVCRCEHCHCTWNGLNSFIGSPSSPMLCPTSGLLLHLSQLSHHGALISPEELQAPRPSFPSPKHSGSLFRFLSAPGELQGTPGSCFTLLTAGALHVGVATDAGKWFLLCLLVCLFV